MEVAVVMGLRHRALLPVAANRYASVVRKTAVPPAVRKRRLTPSRSAEEAAVEVGVEKPGLKEITAHISPVARSRAATRFSGQLPTISQIRKTQFGSR